MKKISNYLWCAIVCIALLPLNSCKKGSSTSAKTSLLTSAPWKVKVTEWHTTGGSWVSPPSWKSVSAPGTVITFFDNGTLTTGSSSGSAGTWQLSADRQQLVLFNPSAGTSTTLTIAALTENTLQLTSPLDKDTYNAEQSGGTWTYTYYDTERTTFTH